MANSTENLTSSDTPDIGLGIAGNLTMVEPLSQWPSILWQHRDLLILESRIVFSAVACIYLGAHAALRRPPSARPPQKKGTKMGQQQEDEEDEKDDHFVQGMLPSDAIMLPLLAGTVLVGLYYLIKWLENPAILNKILGAYFSIMSLASMTKLFKDALHMLTSFVFPDVWTSNDGTVYHFDPAKRCQYRLSDSGEKIPDERRNSPIPGDSRYGLILSDRKRLALWKARHLLQEQWTVRFALHGVAKEKFQVRLNDIVAVFLAIGANMANYASKSNFISNIMGYAFSYTGIIMMSPTTFTTGSAVLFALFFYDIYMVFYTPYMVTVATKLEVPIKLVFDGPKKSSMLGLGDIVIPGMFIGLCLRFDNFLYYHRQRKLVPVELDTTQEGESAGQLVTSKDTQRVIVKPRYVNPQGQWGNRFWATRLPFLTKKTAPYTWPALKASRFSKTYFHAAMVGYLIAMLVTLAIMLIYQHAQPALLYLVPGVVLAVWLTGLCRGELREMWTYTEDGSLDKEDVVVEVDADGKVVKQISDAGANDSGVEKKGADEKAEANKKSKKDASQQDKSVTVTKKPNNYVFLLTVKAPASLVEEIQE